MNKQAKRRNDSLQFIQYVLKWDLNLSLTGETTSK